MTPASSKTASAAASASGVPGMDACSIASVNALDILHGPSVDSSAISITASAAASASGVPGMLACSIASSAAAVPGIAPASSMAAS